METQNSNRHQHIKQSGGGWHAMHLTQKKKALHTWKRITIFTLTTRRGNYIKADEKKKLENIPLERVCFDKANQNARTWKIAIYLHHHRSLHRHRQTTTTKIVNMKAEINL